MMISLDKVQKIVKHYSLGIWGKKAVILPDWDASEIALAIYDGCNKYKVDMILALAQGVVESHFGVAPTAKRSRATRNIYNVGNVDSGADETQGSWREGVMRYARLMAREYNWAPGSEVSLQMMLDHDFYRPRGGRYASAPNYTLQVGKVASRIMQLTHNL